MSEARIVREWLRDHEAEQLRLVRELTELESPTGDLPALAAAAGVLARMLAPLGPVERVEIGGRAHLRLLAGGNGGRPAAAILCHYDTVWPRGTLASRPFHVVGGRAVGPGVLDMKASIAQAVYALRAIAETGLPLAGGASLLVTADEEEGNPTSRGIVGAVGRDAGTALVLEPALPAGGLKTSRKGIAHAHIRVRGRSAHAGLDPHGGVDAGQELARLALHVPTLADRPRGTTVTVGVLRAGDRRNVVPGWAELQVDVRAETEDELERVVIGLRALTPRDPGAVISVDADVHRPPMPRNEGTARLAQVARDIARELGLEIAEGHSGGGSEANLTAAEGVPTLDGLGPSGGGAHADNEFVEIDSLHDRTALLAGMLVAIGRDG